MDIWYAIKQLFTYDPDHPMLFNSGQFLFVFTVFMAIYAAIYKNKLSRTLYVLVFSFFFYYKSSGRYLGILLLTVIVDYGLALLIYQSKTKAQKKLYLILSLVSSLGLLFYFKYTNFFLENVAAANGEPFQRLDIFLPIGISFYTFQTLSYIIDVYRGEIKPTNNFLDYAFYMTFFPHLVAGPIVRAKFFLPQLNEKVILDRVQINTGLFLVIIGLLKKAVLADYIAQYNDLIFADPKTYSGFENLMAIYGYTLQIYCDFSGYSDIAIGIAKMMGFELGSNFNKPYQALNLTDFWRRWHISLSQWLRDYLYVPLGGNRKGRFRTYLNSFLTMLIGGFWHGPSWNFVFWGASHGVGLAIHKFYTETFKPTVNSSLLGKALSWLITFHFVVFLWIFFRAKDFTMAWDMIHSIVYNMDLAYVAPFLAVRKTFVLFVLIGFAIHFIPSKWFPAIADGFVRMPFWAKAVAFVITIQLIIQYASETVQPFIYFQF
jgi:alginate O-acetyltransferase complex protein AlgI